MGPKAVMDRYGKPHPIGIRSPDRPARSQSLCRLSYLAHIFNPAVTELLQRNEDLILRETDTRSVDKFDVDL